MTVRKYRVDVAGKIPRVFTRNKNYTPEAKNFYNRLMNKIAQTFRRVVVHKEGIKLKIKVYSSEIERLDTHLILKAFYDNKYRQVIDGGEITFEKIDLLPTPKGLEHVSIEFYPYICEDKWDYKKKGEV